jgi:hypothetical protein
MLMRVRTFFLSIVAGAAAGIALAASASAADRVTCADERQVATVTELDKAIRLG